MSKSARRHACQNLPFPSACQNLPVAMHIKIWIDFGWFFDWFGIMAGRAFCTIKLQGFCYFCIDLLDDFWSILHRFWMVFWLIWYNGRTSFLHHKVTGFLLFLHRFVGWFWFCQEDSKERCFHNKWSSNVTPAIQSIIQRLFHRHRVCTSLFNKTHSQVCNWIIYIFAGTSRAVAVSVDSLHAVFVVRIHSRFFDWFWTKLAYEFLFRASCALALMRSELLPAFWNRFHNNWSSDFTINKPARVCRILILLLLWLSATHPRV